MERTETELTIHGIIGAILAAAVVAVWFFVVDVANGEPFYTPARLASIVLGEDFQRPWPRLVAVYSILHLGVFIGLGLAAAWFLRLIAVDPGLTLGAVFGIGVFNAVHYTGLLVTGTNLLTVVPVGHVLAANLAGGMAMMAYLHRMQRAESPLGWSVLKRYPLLYDGLITGLIGAAAVAFWFFMIDLLRGEPFSTPAALGSAILLGARSPGEVQFTIGVIAAYSFLHIAAFAAVGIGFAWLVQRFRRAPGFWLRGLLVLALMEGLFVGTVGIASGWVIEELGGLAILVANVLAIVAMGLTVWRRHPELRRKLSEQRLATGA